MILFILFSRIFLQTNNPIHHVPLGHMNELLYAHQIYDSCNKQEEHLTGVNRIIAEASVLEDADVVKDEQHRREEIRKKSYNPDSEFYNAKY